MKVVCITGGMGSGKSTVARMIEVLGYPVYYSDERAKCMYFLPEVKAQMLELLGTEAYLSERELNRSYIARKIFSDDALRNKVNAIIHQAVRRDFYEYQKEHLEARIIFKESALIFEAGLQKDCDKIILVTAPKDIRIERIKGRDGMREEEIISRMSKQWDDEKKIPLADFVIVNDEREALLPKVLEIVEKIEGRS